MTRHNQTDLALWLKSQGADAELITILLSIADACVEIDQAIQTAAQGGKSEATGIFNVQGEEQKPLDIISNDIVLRHLGKLEQIAAFASEEIDDLIVNSSAAANAPFAVCFDPLDGSSNIEINGSIGTIFSVLRLYSETSPVTETDVMGAAQNQIAAGYVLYGPATILVLTTGKTVASFVFDQQSKWFVAQESGISIVESTAEYAINSAYLRLWEPAIAQYVEQCQLGKSGPRARDFGMRWMGAMVADVHRLFVRGGIFIYPALAKPGGENGKLRFIYEANPMAMLVEVAGGKALMRNTRIMEFKPESLHQRVPVVLGSAREVEYLAKLYSQ